jgi:CheY-like chemotaxis protein
MIKPLALIVEDDPHLNQIFALTLEEAFEIETISDGSHAIQRVSEIIPKLIILDINLPGASGAQVLDVIRADPRLESTRVIIATANPQEAERLRDEADIVLLKPISPTQLRELADRMKA